MTHNAIGSCKRTITPAASALCKPALLSLLAFSFCIGTAHAEESVLNCKPIMRPGFTLDKVTLEEHSGLNAAYCHIIDDSTNKPLHPLPLTQQPTHITPADLTPGVWEDLGTTNVLTCSTPETNSCDVKVSSNATTYVPFNLVGYANCLPNGFITCEKVDEMERAIDRIKNLPPHIRPLPPSPTWPVPPSPVYVPYDPVGYAECLAKYPDLFCKTGDEAKRSLNGALPPNRPIINLNPIEKLKPH